MLTTKEYQQIFADTGDFFIRFSLDEAKKHANDYKLLEEEYQNIETAILNITGSKQTNNLDVSTKNLYLLEFVIALSDYWISRGGNHWDDLGYFAGLFQKDKDQKQNEKLLPKLFEKQSRLLFRQGEYNMANKLLEKGIKLAVSGNDKSTQAHLLYLQGAMARRLHNYDESRRYCNESLDLMRIVSDPYGEAIALYNLGAVEDEDKKTLDLKKAESYFNKSLKLFQKLDKKERAARTKIRVAKILHLQGKNSEALNLLVQVDPIIAKEEYPRTYTHLRLIHAKAKLGLNEVEAALDVAYGALGFSKSNNLQIESQDLKQLIITCQSKLKNRTN